jgi:dTDP-4-amino-4,6-dideoxygalactose transaminase
MTFRFMSQSSMPTPAADLALTPIPFNKPYSVGTEFAYIEQAIQNGHISGNGPFTKRAEALLEQITGSHKALLTTSCTDALEMAAALIGIQPGDEVIVPSFTFVSTVNAFVLRGAVPIFIDIRPDTLNLDEALLPELISPRTRAIVPVHYAGVGCAMDRINEIAAAHGIAVVEDNAHGLFGRYRGKKLGTFGQLSALSFHETKNISCGEGGALMINDPALVERAEVIREKGTNRSRFLRGQVDKYTWVDIGSSYLPSDLLAAYLVAQLEARDDIQRKRGRLWMRYYDALRSWAAEWNVTLPFVPDDCEVPFHMFQILLPTEDARDRLIRALGERRIHAVFHYVPLHSAPMGRAVGTQTRECPVTDDVSARLLRLPLFNAMTDAEQDRTLEVVTSFRI